MPDKKPASALPMQTRAMPVTSVDEAARTVDICWTTGARVRRYDWNRDRYYYEELEVSPEAIDLSRLESGAPLLNTHNKNDLSDVIGVVARAWLEKVEGMATVRFSKRDDVEPIFQDVVDKIIRNVSVGYIINKITIIEGEADLPIYRATSWQPYELSLVPVGADQNTGTRSEPSEKNYPCEFLTPSAAADTTTKERTMPQTNSAAETTATTTQAAQRSQAEIDAATRAAVEAATAAETQRGIDIRASVRAAKLDDTLADDLIARKIGTDEANRQILAKLAERSAATETRSGGLQGAYMMGDEGEQRREFIANAIVHRMNPAGTKLEDGAREYRHLSLLRLAEDTLAAQGQRVRGLSGMEIAARAMMTGSDLPAILANVLNKRLRQAYMENTPSYQRWARRAPNAPDFKSITVAQLSGAPDLIKVNEHGEIKYGKLSDGKETYSVLTYARKVAITRQVIINDDLRAIDRLASGFGASANRLENRTTYAILTANAQMADGVELFDAATHKNYTSSGTAISATSLGVGRTLMRKQKGLQNEELNIAPAFLIVPPSLEQVAYQYTSAQYVPAKSSDVNEFRAGGRTALEPIVEAVLEGNSATAWYLAADGSQVDTVEYCYLDGSEGAYLETGMDFDIDGMVMKARLDFAAKDIDHRGLYKNVGA